MRFIAFLAASTAFAQSPEFIAFQPAEFGWAEKQVTGKPYSAEITVETVQSLADGNRIVRKNVSRVWRDEHGRTRREQTIETLGPNAPAKAQEMITVHDPVAKVNYTLDPERRVARRTVIAAPKSRNAGATLEHSVDILVSAPGQGPEPAIQFLEAPIAAGHAIIVSDGAATATQSETLGARKIEDLECTGVRRTAKIPAGQIGNERELVTVTEEWYSPRLDAIVLAITKDPRFGETTRRVSHVRLDAPEAHLFQVPAGWQVEEHKFPALEVPAIQKRGAREE